MPLYVSYLGPPHRVYEVLSRKRGLSLVMIRRLHSGLGIPAESLIGHWSTGNQHLLRRD